MVAMTLPSGDHPVSSKLTQSLDRLIRWWRLRGGFGWIRVALVALVA